METKRITRNLLRSEISDGIKKDRDIRIFRTILPEIGFTYEELQDNFVIIENETPEEDSQSLTEDDNKPKREKIPREKTSRVKIPREKIPREKIPRVKKVENNGEL